MYTLRTFRGSQAIAFCASLLIPLTVPAPGHAQEAERLNNRALAAVCANCHGTEGRAVEGEAMAPLRGVPKSHLVSRLKDYREGRLPATVMHQLAKGFSDDQIDRIASYYSSLK